MKEYTEREVMDHLVRQHMFLRYVRDKIRGKFGCGEVPIQIMEFDLTDDTVTADVGGEEVVMSLTELWVQPAVDKSMKGML